MTTRITALFDRSTDARRAMSALDEADFAFIKVDDESTEFMSTSELTADDLVELGVVGSETGFYANEIQRGSVLLVISCSPGRISELDNIMGRVGLKKVETNGDFRQVRFEEPGLRSGEDIEQINESGIYRQDTVRREFQAADSERLTGKRETAGASGLSRRAYASTATSGAGLSENIEDIPDGVQLLPDPYSHFQKACLDHYKEHFADSEHPFREYLRGYHYGMMLADHEKFQDRSWDDVEHFAHQGWDPQTHGQWEEFRSAVNFGWNMVRRKGQRQRPRA